MKEWEKLYKKILFPPGWLILVLTVISAVSLTAVFMKGHMPSFVTIIICAGSFYSFTVICVAFVTAFVKGYKNVKAKIYNSKYGNRYMADVVFKTYVSLYVSLCVNLLYAAANLFSGIMSNSIWFMTLAAYYIILSIMRFLLVRFVNRIGIGKNRILELRRSRLCGVILMTLNLALSGVVVLVIRKNEGFVYGGILIYVMAIYTFYITTAAIINIFRYRKYNSPVMSTAKSINLAAALVSVLSLETAMLTQFGGESISPRFSKIIIAATGACVCGIVIAISVYTITNANKELEEPKFDNL